MTTDPALIDKVARAIHDADLIETDEWDDLSNYSREKLYRNMAEAAIKAMAPGRLVIDTETSGLGEAARPLLEASGPRGITCRCVGPSHGDDCPHWVLPA